MDSILSIPSRNNAPRILQQGFILSEADLANLNFIDWNRPSYGNNPHKTLQGIANWTRRTMKYSIMKSPLHRAPKRDDFPNWKHAGSHESIGAMYWNWFHHQFEESPEKELIFYDSPDFSGHITFPSGIQTRFWGDIGKCSAFAFVESLLQMRRGDLWITLRDSSTQVILEALIDYFAIDILWQYTHTTHKTDGVRKKKPMQMLLL